MADETDLDGLEEVGAFSLAHCVALQLQSIKQPNRSHFSHIAEIHLLPLLLHFLDLWVCELLRNPVQNALLELAVGAEELQSLHNGGAPGASIAW